MKKPNKKIIIIIICVIIIIVVVKNSGNKQSKTETSSVSIKNDIVLRKESFLHEQKDGYAIKKLREDPQNYLTKDENWYNERIKRLQDCAKGYTNSDEEDEMREIMKEMQTNADVLKMQQIWGRWDGTTLFARLLDELERGDINNINKNWEEKGITKRIEKGK